MESLRNAVNMKWGLFSQSHEHPTIHIHIRRLAIWSGKFEFSTLLRHCITRCGECGSLCVVCYVCECTILSRLQPITVLGTTKSGTTTAALEQQLVHSMKQSKWFTHWNCWSALGICLSNFQLNAMALKPLNAMFRWKYRLIYVLRTLWAKPIVCVCVFFMITLEVFLLCWTPMAHSMWLSWQYTYWSVCVMLTQIITSSEKVADFSYPVAFAYG